MELLLSKKFKLPTIFYIEDRKDVEKIPIGVPFIYGGRGENIKESIIQMLEFEILYARAIATGLPFNFKQILKDAGYTELKDFWWVYTVFIDYKTEEGSDFDIDEDFYYDDIHSILNEEEDSLFKQFIKDSTFYVDVKVLKELNVFPTWLDDIENAIHTNIHNYALFNPNMYNKKLDGMYGALEFTSPGKNLIIIDISGSIPKAASSTCLALSKNLAESFYADLLITGSKSTLYEYENLHELNVNTIYRENGMDNDQVYFKELVTKTEKEYKTAIVFGDNHHPGQKWQNMYNKRTRFINDEDGKKLCRWKVDKVISLHTTSETQIAGYARWFSTKEVEHIQDWIKYLN